VQFIPLGKRTKEGHLIVVQDIVVPLYMTGVTSSINVRKPTEKELLQDVTYKHIYFTNNKFWNPTDNIFADNELFLRCAIVSLPSSASARYVSTVNLIETNPFDFCCCILSKLTLQVTGTHRKGTVSPDNLTRKWYIGVETARRTLERTTQLGDRDFLNIKGTRRLKHTVFQLMFRHLKTDVYTDTMFSKVKSLRQNACAQVFVGPRWIQ
jgi:hypothetical protein